MIVIGLGKNEIVEGKKYKVSDEVGEILIAKGSVYKEGTEKPTIKKRTRKPKQTK